MKVEQVTAGLQSLCQFLVLGELGARTEVLQQIVEAVLYESGNGVMAQDLQVLTKQLFQLDLPGTMIQEALDSLIEAGVAQVMPGGQIALDNIRRESLRTRANAWHATESQVKEEWLAALEDRVGKLLEQDRTDLWNALRSLIHDAVANSELELSKFMSPELGNGDANGELHKVSVPHHIREKYGNEISALMVESLLRLESKAKDEYIAFQLESAYSVCAIQLEDSALDHIRSHFNHLTIFVDTNFLFGVLELHDNNPWIEACQEILDLVKKNNLPISFVYHEDTLRELQDWLDLQIPYITGRRYSVQMSRTLSRSSDIPLFVRKYHEENAKKPLNAQDYLIRYSGLQRTLGDRGFQIFREQEKDKDPVLLRGQREQHFREFLEGRKTYKPRTDDAIRHDIELVMCVSRIAHPADNPLDTGAYVLTTDGHLHAFVKFHMTKNGARPVTILPSTFLQLLFPLLKVSEGFSKALANAFSLPNFRMLSVNYGIAQMRVGQVLASVEGIAEAQARNLLENRVLLEAVRKSKTEEEVVFLVERTVVEENRKLATDNVSLREKQANLALELAELRKDLERERMEREKAPVIPPDRGRLGNFDVLPLVIFSTSIVSGTISISGLWKTSWGWTWLDRHPQRDSLKAYLSCLIVITVLYALSWLIRSRKLAVTLTVLLVPSSIFGFLQLLGRLPWPTK